jgi:WYL_2, Sm-like SH3 beta-barrel fold
MELNQTTMNRSQILTASWKVRKANPTLSWGECQKQAWASYRVKDAMQSGIVEFSFIKVSDGSVRTAKGTLNGELFQYESKGANAPSSPDVIRYFDMGVGEWRSFRVDRFISKAA